MQHALSQDAPVASVHNITCSASIRTARVLRWSRASCTSSSDAAHSFARFYHSAASCWACARLSHAVIAARSLFATRVSCSLYGAAKRRTRTRGPCYGRRSSEALLYLPRFCAERRPSGSALIVTCRSPLEAAMSASTAASVTRDEKPTCTS